MINEKEKYEKILNFNIIVGNQNNNVANEFLSLVNWNVDEAVNLYLYSNSNPNNININNKNNLHIFKYITEYSFIKEGIIDKVSSLFKLPFLKNNAECCQKFIGKIKNLVKTGEVFTNLLKTNKGVIILYNKDTFLKVFQQLDLINNDNQNNYINSILIYPIIDDSIEGKNLIKSLNIIRFPCYLFCQYKSNDVFYIIDKMEGIFYLETFKNTLFPKNNISNIKNINNNINPINKNQDKNKKNKKNRDENDFKNLFGINNKNDNDENIKIKNNLDNNEIHIKNQDKKENNNDNFPLLNNNNDIINNNNESKTNLINNNNNKINDNKNSPRSIQPQQKEQKEYIPDYRDYEFEDIPIIYPGFNQELLQSQIPSYSGINVNDKVDLLSDSQLMKYQEKEMNELERIAEEKEKKEREEKEKIRKEEEEIKRKQEKDKEEKEMFSKLIPPEPEDDNPDKCIIIFRLPDGEKNIQRKFLKTEKIAILYDYIKSFGKEIYSEEVYNNFSIIQTFPFKNFENKLNNTLEEEGLFPNAMLQIKENE